MDKTLGLIYELVSHLEDEIKKILKDNNGFIDARKKYGECDTMYAYVYYEELIETPILGIRLKDDNIEIYCDPYLPISVDMPDAWKDIPDSDWLDIETDTYRLATICDVAEYIEQYVD